MARRSSETRADRRLCTGQSPYPAPHRRWWLGYSTLLHTHRGHPADKICCRGASRSAGAEAYSKVTQWRGRCEHILMAPEKTWAEQVSIPGLTRKLTKCTRPTDHIGIEQKDVLFRSIQWGRRELRSGRNLMYCSIAISHRLALPLLRYRSCLLSSSSSAHLIQRTRTQDRKQLRNRPGGQKEIAKGGPGDAVKQDIAKGFERGANWIE